MNATLLYTHLSRQLFSMEKSFNDNDLGNFMSSDSGILRLKNILICRACREISKEPYSSHYCQHLICKSCYLVGGGKNFGCKWCRNNEDLVRDNQSDIVIVLFKKMCAIMEDVITDSIKSTGTSKIKEKFLQFLKDECSCGNSENVSSLEGAPKTSPMILEDHQNFKNYHKNEIKPPDPPKVVSVDSSSQTDNFSSCECLKRDKESRAVDLSNHPIAITPAESSTMRSVKIGATEDVNHFVGDSVSSTVPDKLPDRSKIKSVNTDAVCERNKTVNEGKLNEDGRQYKYTNIKDNNSAINPDKVYETISNISLKSERKNRSIFEKFGLALSPPPSSPETKHKRRKRQVNRENTYRKKDNCEKELKVLPLKLKMRKVNTENNDEGEYLVHYNIEKIDTPTNENQSPGNSDSESFGKLHNGRKMRSKATVINDYTTFSDDSDFEEVPYSRQRQTKRTYEKLNRDICGCGAGSNVKYFTDICKRARCPCFSQGRACVNCRCRFCSNPYILEEEEEEVYSESDSSNEHVLFNGKTKDECEMVDVETT